MAVLVDSSVWIDYFRGGGKSEKLDYFIDENILVTNDLILAELIPFLMLSNQRKPIRLLESVERLEMRIDWRQIVDFQYRCLKNGVNRIGIPDLIIAQNALQNECVLFSLDRHFVLMNATLELPIIQ